MKIAIFHELPLGGARRAMNEFSQELRKRNQVDLFIVDEKSDPKEKVFYSNYYLYNFSPKKWSGNNWNARLYKDSVELFKLYLLHRDIAKDIAKKRYDVVLISASKYIEAPFILRFVRQPKIYFCHDPGYRMIYEKDFQVSRSAGFLRYYYENLNRFVRKHLDRQNVAHSPFCLVPSRFIAQKFSKIYQVKTKVVYYGVRHDFFTPGKRRKNTDIFYIGSRHPIDGYLLLQETLRNIPQKVKVKKVFFEDEWIDDVKLRTLYQQSKIMFCPAQKEGFGAVPLEAMSCGVPVIALDEAGHKETVIPGKTGYLIPADGAIAAKYVAELLKDEKKRTGFGKNSREYVIKNWSWSVRAKELEVILRNLASVK